MEYKIKDWTISDWHCHKRNYILHYVGSIETQINSRLLQKMSRGHGVPFEADNVRNTTSKYDCPIGILVLLGVMACMWVVFAYLQKKEVEKLYSKTQCEWRSHFLKKNTV